MASDRETKEKLLESARKEFAKDGYMKASLRKICANAGVTTGALYFFFQDKADLFQSIVQEPYSQLLKMVQEHFAEDVQLLARPNAYAQADGDHEALVHMLIHHLYANREAFLLLLTKSQGTYFEDCIDRLVDLMEQNYRVMAEGMARNMPGMCVNDYMMHWLTHMNIDAFIHLLTHEQSEERALYQMQKIMDYLVKGWMEMILIPAEENECQNL